MPNIFLSSCDFPRSTTFAKAGWAFSRRYSSLWIWWQYKKEHAYNCIRSFSILWWVTSACSYSVCYDEKEDCFSSLITCGAKLLNADWLRQRAFFLNHEGMITWSWLAERASSALSWFPAWDEFEKSSEQCSEHSAFEFYIIAVISSNMKENRQAEISGALVE